MNEPYYETDRALSEYLLFHYGSADQILPFGFGPVDSLNYPVRCVTECLEPAQLPADARALDLGCSVGRSSFELARVCQNVIGIDFSKRFIECADRLRLSGSVGFDYIEEGTLRKSGVAVVPAEIDRDRISFETGDAMDLRADLRGFDVVLMANLIDRLSNPHLCLERLPTLIDPGGQLIISSPYTWLAEYTPPENWVGGYTLEGSPLRTRDGLLKSLEAKFELLVCKDIPFLIREHARKYQWSVAEATVWKRR